MIVRATIDATLRAAASDPELAHIARWSRYAILAEWPEGSVRIVVRDAVVEIGGASPELETLHLRAPARAWRELLSPDAPARRHDLLALTKMPDGIEVVSGSATMIRHLRTITRLVEIGCDHA